MATPSPLNWSERDKQTGLRRPPVFQYAEDQARHDAAMAGGATGKFETQTIQNGPNKGKTRDQVQAENLQARVAQGMSLKNPQAPKPAAASPQAAQPSQPSSSSVLKMPPASALGSRARQAASSTLKKPSSPPRVSAQASTAGGKMGAAADSSVGASALKMPPGGRIHAASAAAAGPRTTPPSWGSGFRMPAPSPSSPNEPQLALQVLAQGMEDQRRDITQRGTDGSVMYSNGASISPATPTGSRTLTHARGSGSVTFGGPTPIKTFDGMSPTQFGAAAAERQKAPNAFVTTPPRLNQPASPAPVTPQSPAPAVAAATSPVQSAQQPVPAAPAPSSAPAPVTPAVAPAAPMPSVASSPAPRSGPVRLAPIPDGTGNPFPTSAGVPSLASSVASGALAGAAAPTPKPAPMPLSQVTPLNQRRPTPPSLRQTGSSFAVAGTRAAGGPVTGGQPYLVGEQGPEIVVPSQNGTVIPNHRLPAGFRPPRLGAPVAPVGSPSTPSRPLASFAAPKIKPPSLRTPAAWKPISPPSLISPM